jgi:glyoxylate reductase
VSPPTLLITRYLPEPVRQLASATFEAKLWAHDAPIGDQLTPWAQGCNALLVMMTDRLDAPKLRQLPTSVHAVSTNSVGYDHIKLATATQLGIPVFNTPDLHTDAVAEIALLLFLSAAHDAAAAEPTLRSGGWGPWSPTRFLGQQLNSRSLDISGIGRIGQGIAKRPLALSMRIHYYNRTVHASASGFTHHTSLEPLQAHNDMFCICAPSTPQSRGAINRTRLALLPIGAAFVTIARGDLVDEDALIDAITSGYVGSAGLDVFRKKPDINSRFLKLPRTAVFSTPAKPDASALRTTERTP